MLLAGITQSKMESEFEKFDGWHPHICSEKLNNTNNPTNNNNDMQTNKLNRADAFKRRKKEKRTSHRTKPHECRNERMNKPKKSFENTPKKKKTETHTDNTISKFRLCRTYQTHDWIDRRNSVTNWTKILCQTCAQPLRPLFSSVGLRFARAFASMCLCVHVCVCSIVVAAAAAAL